MRAGVFVVAMAAMSQACGLAIESSGGMLTPITMPPRTRIALVPFENGHQRNNNNEMSGSGASVTAALQLELVARGTASMSTSTRVPAEALREARGGGASYVLRGEITEWQDYSVWSVSGETDSAAVAVELVDLRGVALSVCRVRARHRSDNTGSPDRFVADLARATVACVLGPAH